MHVVLISTYELGHQPFGLASPKAWLERDGHGVRTQDLAVDKLDEALIREAEMVAFYLPMHTATRLALPVIDRVRRLNPAARIVCYGLYAPLNAELLRGLGVEAVLGGEFEAALVRLARGEAAGANALERLEFITPDRGDLPGPDRYAKLHSGREIEAGRVHGGEPRLQASVPALSSGPGVSRTVSRGRARRRARRYSPASGGRGNARHFRRSGFLQWAFACRSNRRGLACRISRGHL